MESPINQSNNLHVSQLIQQLEKEKQLRENELIRPEQGPQTGIDPSITFTNNKCEQDIYDLLAALQYLITGKSTTVQNISQDQELALKSYKIFSNKKSGYIIIKNTNSDSSYVMVLDDDYGALFDGHDGIDRADYHHEVQKFLSLIKDIFQNDKETSAIITERDKQYIEQNTPKDILENLQNEEQ